MVSISLEHDLTLTEVLLELGLLLILKKLEDQYQPLLALVFPAARELFVWLGKKAVKNCTNGDVTKARLFWIYSMSTNHTIILCYVISSIADDTRLYGNKKDKLLACPL